MMKPQKVVEMPVAHHTGVTRYVSGQQANVEYESENYHGLILEQIISGKSCL